MEIPEERGSSQTTLEWKFQVDGVLKRKKTSHGEGMDIFWNYKFDLNQSEHNHHMSTQVYTRPGQTELQVKWVYLGKIHLI